MYMYVNGRESIYNWEHILCNTYTHLSGSYIQEYTYNVRRHLLQWLY